MAKSNAIYILKYSDGDYLNCINYTGGTAILSYTKQFDQALKLDKSEAEYWCRQKPLFTKIKLAG
jgi:hypothetical protein